MAQYELILIFAKNFMKTWGIFRMLMIVILLYDYSTHGFSQLPEERVLLGGRVNKHRFDGIIV